MTNPRRSAKAQKGIKMPNYIIWRDGRPRFLPGPRERALGFKGLDLRHGMNGDWFTLAEVWEWGPVRFAEIMAARQGVERPKPVSKTGDSLADLLKDYQASPDFMGNSQSFRIKQRQHMNYILFERDDPHKRTLISQAPARFLDSADIKGFFEWAVRIRKLHQARAMIMLISAAYRWGRLSTHWRLKHNPCHRLDLPSPPPRVFIWTSEAITAVVATADASGRPEIGDAIYLGIFSGQRQADRLKMLDSDLERDLMFFRQNKRGAIVEIPQVYQLERRLTAARERRRNLPFTVIAPNILINEASGREISQRHYNTLFNQAKALAESKARADGNLALADLINRARDQDLRDTIVTWLALAGANMPMIASITGHSLQAIQTTIKHYIAIDRTMAGQAFALLEKWLQTEGIAL
jgi:integrase